MLQPTKHSHPDRTVIYLSLILLKRVKNKRVAQFDMLLELVKEIKGGDALFMPALGLLFLLGLIHYHPKTDAFEFVG